MYYGKFVVVLELIIVIYGMFYLNNLEWVILGLKNLIINYIYMFDWFSDIEFCCMYWKIK